MIKFIDGIFADFRGCFSRKATFEWFVIIVVGLMLRSDHLGVTSIVRELSLSPKHYDGLLHFFRSSAWSLASLRDYWLRIVHRIAPLMHVGERVVLVGDGVKQAKEGRRMPGVKKLHQESGNSSESEFIFGHLFGAIGILAGTAQKWFCVPLLMSIQDGVKMIFSWGTEVAKRQSSHVVQMIDQGYSAARVFKNALLLLDRYFLSVPALKRLDMWNQTGAAQLNLIVKAKSNAVAYEHPAAGQNRRGRPPKKGRTVKLSDLFHTRADEFQTTTVTMYGKEQTLQFLCLDLLWGQGLYHELRFVLVRLPDRLAIFACTDLMLAPEEIIRLYCYRFKIESTFREMKQVMGAFNYHFWSKSMPKLNRFLRKEAPHPLEQVTSAQDRQRIQSTLLAIEGFIMCSCIATGLVQLISLEFSHRVPGLLFRYLRTSSNDVVSEATVTFYLRKHIFHLFARNPCFSVTQIIHSKQDLSCPDVDLLAS